MELRQLRYFLSLAETLSFTRSAARLHITQPTLSHQIKQLERTTGPLFDRTRQQVRLTAQGRLLKPYAERVVNEIRSATVALAELGGLARGEVAIGVFRSFSSSLLPDVFARFNREYPHVRLTVQEMPHVRIERALIEGTLDFAVAYGPPVSERIAAEEIFSEPLALVVSKQHPWYGRRRIAVEQLQGLELALVPRGTRSRQMIDDCLAARGVAPKIVMEMNSVDAVLATVRRSELATICVARTLADADDLRALKLDEPSLERTTAILWLAGSYRSAASLKLTEAIRDTYAALSRRG